MLRAYHRKLVPVEVGEHHAKDWFRSLLSGIEFLHKRGVVHNDIKYDLLSGYPSTYNSYVLIPSAFTDQRTSSYLTIMSLFSWTLVSLSVTIFLSLQPSTVTSHTVLPKYVSHNHTAYSYHLFTYHPK